MIVFMACTFFFAACNGFKTNVFEFGFIRLGLTIFLHLHSSSTVNIHYLVIYIFFNAWLFSLYFLLII